MLVAAVSQPEDISRHSARLRPRFRWLSTVFAAVVPHWYLMVIGSDPSVCGAGFGQALMHSRLDCCGAEHAPAYLEASEASLAPYYTRFGFE